MSEATVERVTRALASFRGDGSFAVELRCPSAPLSASVAGVGPLRFPLSAATVRKLCAVARPAPFGRRDETLYDTHVRDTWQIAKSRVKVDARRWKPILQAQLLLVREALGLPAEGKLEARLDKMLVYGPGQFFAPHQDSERDDDMVGSLVVLLPSRHTGGAIVVRHRGQERAFQAPDGKELSLVAFYADCEHEVKPVESGFRVALTYQLLYRGKGSVAAPGAALDDLSASLDAYFTTSFSRPYSREAPQPPDRLVYLLDHQYTQRSLRASQLKNGDRVRVAALREVAERDDYAIFLALADVHESWSCEEEEDWARDRPRYYDEHDWDDEADWEDAAAEDAEDDDRSETHELIDLIDSTIELQHWVDLDGRQIEAVDATAARHEVCWTVDSDALEPFQYEHEGYQGNYGNTVDRWYHRAAVILWPRTHEFRIRAKVSPHWALRELSKQLKRGELAAVRERARELLPSWTDSARSPTQPTFVRDLLKLAERLDDADLALALANPLSLDRLNAGNAPHFVALIERYGASWGQRLLTGWASMSGQRHPAWLPLLPRLTRLLAGGAQGFELAGWLLARERASLERRHVALRSVARTPAERGARHLGDVESLLEAASILGASDVKSAILALLLKPETALPLVTTGKLLRRCVERRTPSELSRLGLELLYDDLVAELESALATRRRPDDWSIELPKGCACALCQKLAIFLRSSTETQLEWPIAQMKRQHVEHRVAVHDLPVSCVTRRRGSPHKLVLTKQSALFEREEALRGEHEALLSWLKEHESVFNG